MTTASIAEKRPLIIYIFLVWLIIALFFSIGSISAIQNSASAIFAKNLLENAKSNGDQALAMKAQSLIDQQTQKTQLMFMEMIIETVGLVASAYFIMKSRKIGVTILLITVIVGLILDFLSGGNLLIINGIGLVISLVLRKRSINWA